MNRTLLSLRGRHHTWALVLAGGEGQRLRPLTTLADGTAVPKQYCSLWDGPTLFQESLARAHTVAARERVCAVVAAAHRQWWEVPMWQLPARNTIAQPDNRGTGIGVLLSLLHIQRRDAAARIVLLPSDHHVQDEASLAQALQAAAAWAGERVGIVLLGFPADQPSTQLGYIVPGDADGDGVFRVVELVEKPDADTARALIGRQALWNSFLIAASARALLRLYERHHADLVERLREAVDADADTPVDGLAAAEIYEQLPMVDFSRDLLRGQESQLRVLVAPTCGWSDLGTPWAVADLVGRMPPRHGIRRGPWAASTLSLSAQHLKATESEMAWPRPG